jgi:hypothetical protein
MSDNWKLNRPELKYSNYFKDPPPIQSAGQTDAATDQMEKAGWILFWLCLIPFLGGVFSVAVMVIGVIMLTRNRLNTGLMFIIVGPIANAIVTGAVLILFFAGIMGAAAGAARLTP